MAENVKLEHFFENGKAIVWRKPFAIVKSDKPVQGAFAVIQDKRETTIVISEDLVDPDEVTEIESGFRLITFDMNIPLEIVGFLARIAQELAKEGVSIFILSTFSTNHLLVREKDLDRAVGKLQEIGITVKNM